MKEIKLWGLLFFVIITACGVYYYVSHPSQPSVSPDTAVTTTQNNAAGVSDAAFGIRKDMKGKIVTIQAYIVSISKGKGHVFPVFKDPANGQTIKGVLFDKDEAENLERKKFLEEKRKSGAMVTVEGKVDVYNDEVEIVIEKVY